MTITLRPDYSTRRVEAIDANGEIIGTYASRSEAAAALGIDITPPVLTVKQEKEARKSERASRPRGGWGSSRSTRR